MFTRSPSPRLGSQSGQLLYRLWEYEGWNSETKEPKSWYHLADMVRSPMWYGNTKVVLYGNHIVRLHPFDELQDFLNEHRDSAFWPGKSEGIDCSQISPRSYIIEWEPRLGRYRW